MPRLSFTLLLPVALIAFVPIAAAPVPKMPPDTSIDADGHPLPKGAIARLGSRPFHGYWLRELAFSADGKKVLAMRDFENVAAWDAETGKRLPVMPIKWGDEADGEQVIASTIAGSHAIFITELINNAAPNRLDTKPEFTAYACDLSDGRILAHKRIAGRVKFYELPHRMWTAVVSTDGKYLAAAPEKTGIVEVVDMTTGKRLHTQKLTGAGNPGVYISPESKTLYISEYMKPLRRFELVSGKELPEVADATNEIDLLAASADGKWLAAREWVSRKNEGGRETGESFLTLRDMAANKTLGKLELGANSLDFGFADTDSIIVLAAKYSQPPPLAAKYSPPLTPKYTLSRWNATTLKKEWEVPGPDLPYKLSIRVIVAPGGKQFMLTDQLNFVYMYDAATGKMVEPSGHSTLVSWIGFSPDGAQITTVGRDGLRTWTPTGERKSADSLPGLSLGRTPTRFGEYLDWATLTDDGEHLVWVALGEGDKKSAQLIGWDLAKSQIDWRMPVEGEGPDHVLTRDGKRCVGITWNNAKRVWEVAVYDGPAGKILHSWTCDKIKSLGKSWWWPMVLSADRETLFAVGDGLIGLDVSTGKEKLRIDSSLFKNDKRYSHPAFPMAVSADGQRIAVIKSQGSLDALLSVFEIKTGKELATHNLGRMYYPALQFSRNGKQVAVWSAWSETVQVCDADSSETPPRMLAGTCRAKCAAFSPNGISLSVGYEDGTALIWDLTVK